MVVKFTRGPGGDGVRPQEGSVGRGEPWTRVNAAAAARRRQFRQPTDVDLGSAGNIFISDGYINSRVAKFDKTATG
jgi:hypothetical protein